MKFLCDKCKTRYSIGDDRVRGKILKIRCKNCANVITVREGMDIAPSEPRRNPTQAIQIAQITGAAASAAGQGALGAAFASQLAKPPPALEEEWYVSIDGNQEGPFSLTNAQRWVASKPYEAELHCWSEGFDDWLPVDKVSHFRNLRKRPEPRRPPTMPPPIPRLPPRDEPKPLFAATMASLEKSAGAPDKAGVRSPVGSAIPVATKANGNGVSAALAAAFQHEEPAEQPTRVDAPPFTPSAESTPAADEDDDDNLDIGEVSRVVKLADLAAMSRPKTPSASPATRAAGLSNPALRPSAPSLQARTGMTGSHARLSPSELGMNVDPALAGLAPAGQPLPDESLLAHSFAKRHRRGMIVLISFAAVMVLGVIGAVVFVTSEGNDDLPMGLGGTRVIDTSRPEDIVRRQLPPPPNAGSDVEATQKKPAQQRPVQRPTIATTHPEEPETGPGSSLDPSEIEAMAAKYGEGTKRCYMRAQKGVLGLEIADTKKIDVTLTVAKDGTVSSVQLSKHANNEFGQCLIARIKAWKFRESKGGTFRIALAFSAS